MCLANSGIVLTAPDVGFELQSISLRVAVQRLSISRKDSIDDWVVGIDRHARFVQATRNRTAQLIPDRGEVDRRYVNADTLGEKAIQPGNARSQRIVDDAVQQPVRDHRELDFRRPNRTKRQDEDAVAA